MMGDLLGRCARLLARSVVRFFFLNNLHIFVYRLDLYKMKFDVRERIKFYTYHS